MTDPNSFERAAMDYASRMAGEYIESLPTTDLARLTAEQWSSLIEVICGGYVDSLVVQRSRATESLAKVQTAA